MKQKAGMLLLKDNEKYSTLSIAYKHMDPQQAAARDKLEHYVSAAHGCDGWSRISAVG